MGDSKRIKGQDHPSGSSEYYLMVPGGIQTLKDALVDINVNGELLICWVAVYHAAASSTETEHIRETNALLLSSTLLSSWWQQHDYGLACWLLP